MATYIERGESRYRRLLITGSAMLLIGSVLLACSPTSSPPVQDQYAPGALVNITGNGVYNPDCDDVTQFFIPDYYFATCSEKEVPKSGTGVVTPNNEGEYSIKSRTRVCGIIFTDMCGWYPPTSLRPAIASAATPSPVRTLAPAATATSSAIRTQCHEYTIRSGDTLSEIAKESGTSSGRLQEDNKIQNPNLIYAGEVLVICAGK